MNQLVQNVRLIQNFCALCLLKMSSLKVFLCEA